jgi:aryl-alcohol dehydrogenase-like predicted oxidoreductase
MMVDQADTYGAGHNEALILKALKQSSTNAFIASKFGIVFDEDETGTEVPTRWGSH